MIEYTLFGEPRSWQRIGHRVGSFGGATPVAVREEQARHREAAELCRPLDWMLEGRFVLHVVAYVGVVKKTGEGKRPDVDNLGKLVMDGIQGVAFENDNLVEKLVVERRVDALDPRTEVRVVRL